MSTFLLLTKAVLLGFAIAAPIGPISLLCMRLSITRGLLAGYVAGVAIALADMVYAGIACFGLVAVSGFLLSYSLYIRILGGIVLIILGIRFVLSKLDMHSRPKVSGPSYFVVLGSTFLLTLTNPMTILAFMSVFSGMGIKGGDFGGSLVTILGISLGSLLWWIILATIVAWTGKKISAGRLNIINKVFGAIVISFGALIFYSAVLGCLG